MGVFAATTESLGLTATLVALAAGSSLMAAAYLSGAMWLQRFGGWVLVGSAGAAFHAWRSLWRPATRPAATPVTGIAFGVGAFSEHLQTGPPAVAGEAVGLALMLAGVFLLARSPVVHGAAAAGAETAGGTRVPRPTGVGSPSGRRAG